MKSKFSMHEIKEAGCQGRQAASQPVEFKARSTVCLTETLLPPFIPAVSPHLGRAWMPSSVWVQENLKQLWWFSQMSSHQIRVFWWLKTKHSIICSKVWPLRASGTPLSIHLQEVSSSSPAACFVLSCAFSYWATVSDRDTSDNIPSLVHPKLLVQQSLNLQVISCFIWGTTRKLGE